MPQIWVVVLLIYSMDNEIEACIHSRVRLCTFKLRASGCWKNKWGIFSDM